MFLNLEEIEDNEMDNDSVSQPIEFSPIQISNTPSTEPPRRQQMNRFQLKKSTDDASEMIPKRNLQKRVNKAQEQSPSKDQDQIVMDVPEEEQKQQQPDFDQSARLRQRQMLQEQQKQILMQKQRLTHSSHGVVENGGYRQLMGRSDGQQEIDYDQLALIVENSSYSYEPGSSNYNAQDNLPTLQKQDNRIQFQEQSPIIQNLFDQNKHNNDYQNMEINKEQQSNSNTGIPQVIVMKQRDEQYQDQQNSDSDIDVQDDQQLLMDQGRENDLRKELKQQNEKVLIEESKVEEPKVIMVEDNHTNIQKPVLSITLKKVTYPKPLDPIIISDMIKFLNSPAPQGGMIQCTIKRDRSGLGQFYPKYHLHLSNGFRYLMSAKKRACNNTSNYLVSASRSDMSSKGPNYLGKVRSNFMGTEFILYDNGVEFKKALNRDQCRSQLGAVFYESNIMGTKGPRKMKVLLPKLNSNNEIFEYKPNNLDREGLLYEYKIGKKENLMEVVNRKPKWNEQVQAFVLNFYGRVDKPSVKNFQLVEEGGDDLILLQFGRVGSELFNLDFQYPLSPLQAFQLTLTSFDYKIACE